MKRKPKLTAALLALALAALTACSRRHAERGPGRAERLERPGCERGKHRE